MYDIEKRIATGSKAMGVLSGCWNNDHVDVFHKYLQNIYGNPSTLATLGMQILGSKRIKSENRLGVFLLRSICRIMKIKMSEVKERKINNEKLRDMFYHIPNIRDLIALRECRFIGKVASRGPNAHPSKKYYVTAWCNNKRPTGAPIMTNKRSIVHGLKILMPEEMGKNNYGDLNRWIDTAMDK